MLARAGHTTMCHVHLYEHAVLTKKGPFVVFLHVFLDSSLCDLGLMLVKMQLLLHLHHKELYIQLHIAYACSINASVKVTMKNVHV